MDLQLEGKVIIVTGGAKGIGAAIVRACAGEGAIPVIVGRDAAAGQMLQAELQAGGASCGLITVDLSTPERCSESVEQTLKSFGVRTRREGPIALAAGDGVRGAGRRRTPLR